MFNTTPTNAIDIKCTEPLFVEFPELLFGTTDDKSVMYFDATAYLSEKHTPQDFSVEDFMRSYCYQIGQIATACNIAKDTVCVMNQDGHTLILSDFAILFLSYTDLYFLVYSQMRTADLLENGVAVSDRYLYQQCATRFTPKVIQSILNVAGEE